MADNLTPHQSGEYNSEIQKTIPYYNLFHNETIDLIKCIRPDVKIWLDTGCGTGTLIQKVLPIFPHCWFFLSDPSEQMVQICRDTFTNERIGILGIAPTLEVTMEQKPDVITAIQSHHYLDKKTRIKTTHHCFDLLNRDGVYIIFENIKPATTEGIGVGLKRWGRFQGANGKSAQQVKNHLSRFDKNYFPITINEHINILKNAGFCTVELFWMSYMQAGFYGIK